MSGMSMFNPHVFVPATREEMEAYISKVRWRIAKYALIPFILWILFLTQSIIEWNKQDLELYQMRLIEGELIEVSFKKVTKYPQAPYIWIKHDSGEVFRFEARVLSHVKRQLTGNIGAHIKVFSEEYCHFLGYFCGQMVNQIELNNQLIVDYENFVRPNNQKARSSSCGFALNFANPFFFFLITIGFFSQARHIEKEIRKRFKSEHGGQ